MGNFEKMLAMANANMSYSQKLYRLTKNREYSQEPFLKKDLGDRMSCICEGKCESLVTRYLINHHLKEAYEVADSRLVFLKPGDVAPEVEGDPVGFFPPVIINRYVDGLALFEWNTVEDGRTWVDEGGYGMQSGNPKFLYSVVNQQLEVIGRFRYIDDDNRVDEYRRNPKQFLTDFPTSVK